MTPRLQVRYSGRPDTTSDRCGYEETFSVCRRDDIGGSPVVDGESNPITRLMTDTSGSRGCCDMASGGGAGKGTCGGRSNSGQLRVCVLRQRSDRGSDVCARASILDDYLLSLSRRVVRVFLLL